MVQIGDFGDFASLSTYDKGKKAIEGKRLSDDWDSFRRALDALEAPFAKLKGYRPRKIYTAGNHEYRVQRYANDNPQINTLPDVFGFMRSRGWEAHPFLQEVEVDGVRYCHLFARTSSGRVTDKSQKFGAPNALTQAKVNMTSCTAGHKPGFDFAVLPNATRTLHSLIAGSFYQHDEDYMTCQGNRYWRGVIVKHEVQGGEYGLMQVSLDFLRRRYAK